MKKKQNIQDINTAKPFVKWVGGKTQLISTIEKVLPSNFANTPNTTYIEPFIGGGAMLFWMLRNHPNITKAVINDINPDLISAYLTIKNKPKQLIKLLQAIQDEYHGTDKSEQKKYFLDKRERFNTKSLDIVENTALFIFLNRTCFNGLYRVNSKGLFNVPFGSYNNPTICDEKTILADSELLQKVVILSGDFEQTLEHVEGNALFYFDPPYKPLSQTSSFNSYAKEVFNDNEQIRLRDFCNKIHHKGYNFILSNSDLKGKNAEDNFFDDLYVDYNINRVWASRMVNANAEKRGKLTELLITNIKDEEIIPIARPA
jgi:DNA adenine methylase